MRTPTFSPANVQPIQKKLYQQRQLQVFVLRLDKLHPVVSGNKWFKLDQFLQAAARENKKTIITFGGPYSNHLVATAAACAELGFNSIGIMRGERPATLSHTLADAQACGMHLHFISRDAYRQKQVPASVIEGLLPGTWSIVPEGGYGREGAEGAAGIMQLVPPGIDHIVVAVGTGTTLAGLSLAAGATQQLLGISVLKNQQSIDAEVKALLPPAIRNFSILHDFHFGGYAKKNAQLIQFMNQWYRDTGIASDFVYTGKMFYAAESLAGAGYFPRGSSILLVHTGGLQGNRSLPKGTLIF